MAATKYIAKYAVMQPALLELNEESQQVVKVGNWALEDHPAYIGNRGSYIVNNVGGYVELTVPAGYHSLRFWGILDFADCFYQVTKNGEVQLNGNQKYIPGSPETEASPYLNGYGLGTYFRLTNLRAGDKIRMTFTGGRVMFFDLCTFYK